MNLQEKLRIAHQLEVLGVDIMEAGFPASSQGDFESVQRIARQAKSIQVAGLCRCMDSDIDRCWEAVKDAKTVVWNGPMGVFDFAPAHEVQAAQGPRSGAADDRSRGAPLRRVHRQRGVLRRGRLPFRT